MGVSRLASGPGSTGDQGGKVDAPRAGPPRNRPGAQGARAAHTQAVRTSALGGRTVLASQRAWLRRSPGRPGGGSCPNPVAAAPVRPGDSRAGRVDQPLRLGPRGGHGRQGALRDHLQSSLPGPPGGGRPGRSLGTGCPHAEASGVPRAPGAAIGVTLPVKDRASYGLVLPQDRLTGQGATAPPDPIRDPASSSSGPQRAAPPPCL